MCRLHRSGQLGFHNALVDMIIVTYLRRPTSCRKVINVTYEIRICSADAFASR